MPSRYQELLAAPRLAEYLGNFGKLKVSLLFQGEAAAKTCWQQQLGCADITVYLRQVKLCLDAIPVIAADTILAIRSYQHYKTELENLGTKLLGANFLYSNSSFRRSDFNYTKSEDGLDQRSSVFQLEYGHQLLLVENFLPALHKLI